MYETKDYKKHILQPAYCKKGNSSLEQEFEKILESSNILWWYKNRESLDDYLGILFENIEDGKLSVFYPDYIVMHKDGTVGIYETKGMIFAQTQTNQSKAEALYKYTQNLSKGRKICGGMILNYQNGWYICDGKNYTFPPDLTGWKNFTIG